MAIFHRLKFSQTHVLNTCTLRALSVILTSEPVHSEHSGDIEIYTNVRFTRLHADLIVEVHLHVTFLRKYAASIRVSERTCNNYWMVTRNVPPTTIDGVSPYDLCSVCDINALFPPQTHKNSTRTHSTHALTPQTTSTQIKCFTIISPTLDK